MKLLVISPNYPTPADKGDRIRTNGVLRLFRELNYEIDLVCVDRRKGEIAQELNFEQQIIYQQKTFKIFRNLLKNFISKKSFTSAFFYNQHLVAEIEHKLQKQSYDLILIFSSAFEYLLPVLSKYQVKVFWDLIDFDSLKWEQFQKQASFLRRWVYQRESFAIREAEVAILKFASLVSIISKREITRSPFTDSQLAKVIVLPQVLPDYKFRREKIVEKQIIFTGQMDYLPNIQAVQFFNNQVMPLLLKIHPETTFIAAGRSPSASLIQECTRTIFTGEVPNISEFVASSAVAVVPLSSVFGMPNKVIEALAIGVPTVVTSDVAETISANPNEVLLVASTPAQYCEQIDSLFRDQSLAKQLSINGQNFVNQKFSLKEIAKKLALELKRLSN